MREIPYEKVHSSLNIWAISELRKKKLKFEPNTSAYVQLLNHINKTILPLKRLVTFSEKFQIPSEHLIGFETLKNKIIKGGDLNPYLSRYLYNADFVDGLLNFYGCHHFHLGIKKKGKFIEGTDLLAIGFVTPNEVFFIDVKPHGESTWYDTEFLEILHKERPDLIERFKVTMFKKTSISVSSINSIKKLRENGYNHAITLKDGSMYMPVNFGQISIENKTLKKKSANFSVLDFDKCNYICRRIYFNINKYLNEIDDIKNTKIFNTYLSDFEIDQNYNIISFCFTFFYIKRLKLKRINQVFKM